jgi:hypothetical protein
MYDRFNDTRDSWIWVRYFKIEPIPLVFIYKSAVYFIKLQSDI